MNQIWIRCFLLILPITVYGQRPTDFSGGNPLDVNVPTDSTERGPLSYRSFALDDINAADGNLDTSLATFHLTESYYQSDFVNGNLGSELSASYSSIFRTDYKVGIEHGPTIYDLLQQDQREMIDVNRTFFNLGYTKSYNLDGSNISLDFYKQFKDRILFNFNYQQLKDRIWLTTAEAKSNSLNLKLFKENKRKNRRYYVTYSNQSIEDSPTRNAVDGTSIGGSVVTHKNTQVRVGHLMVLDTISNPTAHSLSTKFALDIKDYGFNDPSLTSEEEVYYGLLRSTGTSLTLQNRIRQYRLENRYDIPISESKLSFSLDFASVQHSQQSTMTNYLDGIVGAQYHNSNKEGRLELISAVKASVIQQGGEFNISQSISYDLNKDSELSGSISFGSYRPHLLAQNIVVNDTLLRSNNLDKMTALGIEADYYNRSIDLVLGVEASSISNFLIYEARGYTQRSATVNTIAVNAKKSIDIGPIKSSHKVFYQYISDPSIRRPSIQYHGDIHINATLFGGKMAAVIGSSIYLSPSYSVPSFMPVIGEFFPDADIPSSGNILVVNPYANFKVEQFYIFLKGTNVTSRFRSGFQYLAADHPVADFSFSFGIRWILLD